MAPAQARLPRFERKPDASAAIKLTPRDTEILRQLAVNRYLRSTHLSALVDGSSQQILRRLQLLFHHGYIERPRAQLDHYYAQGSSPMVYALASRGAAHLRRHLDMPFEHMAWNRNSANAGQIFLQHALLVSDTMVSLETADGTGSERKLRRFHEMECGLRLLSGSGNPFRWNVQVPGHGDIGVVPDQIFSLEGGGCQPLLCFLEADRGTMPVVRQDLSKSSFNRKLLAYHATWKAGIHSERFGFQRFRVLTVTHSEERAANIADSMHDLPGGHGIFVIATPERIPDPLDLLGS